MSRLALAVLMLSSTIAMSGCNLLLDNQPWTLREVDAGDAGQDAADSGTDSGADSGADGGGHGQLRADPSAYDFGTVSVGAGVAPTTITVTNTGSAPTLPLATQATGPNGTFTLGADSCRGVALQPSKTCSVAVGLSTSAAGVLRGTLTVSNGPSDSAQTQLDANIVTPGAITLAPADQDFGGTVVNGGSGNFPFTARNTGQVVTGTMTTTITGNNAGEFSVVSDSCAGTPLAPAATCIITLRMRPTATGAKTASLVLAATPGGPATAGLHGTGLQGATLSFLPTNVDLGTVDVASTSVAQLITVKNVGGVATTLLGTALSGANAAEFGIASDTCVGQSIPPGQTCSVGLQLKPASRGVKAASLNFSNIPGTASAPLAGIGRDRVTLTVTKSGTGAGTVSGDMIACGATCSEQVARTVSDPVITLTAAPDATSTFTGWLGAGCTGTGACAVTMSQAQTVNAAFTRIQYALNFTMKYFGPAAGSVQSAPAGISCSGPCTASPSYDAGTLVTLTASGTSGYLFNWGGACTGTATVCTVTMSQARTVTLSVTAYNYMFVTSGSFSGNLGGLSGADQLCQTAATTAGLPGSFKAWLSTTTITAPARFPSSRGWIRPDGGPFADSIASLTQQFKVYYPPAVTEAGGVRSTGVHTGTHDDGTFATNNNCVDWTSSSAADFVLVGGSFAGSGAWSSSGGNNCASLNALYCLGTDFNRAMAITPAGGRRAFVTSGNFDTSSGITGADTLCRGEATAASLTNAGSFRAYLATSTASAASRVNAAGSAWVRTDGIPLVANGADLFASNLVAPLAVHADGATYITPTINSVRTGSMSPNLAGTASSTCSDWSLGAAGGPVVRGWPSLIDRNYFGFAADQTCGTSQPIYCLEP